MSIGDDLRNARRSRGMTIERLALITKISPTVLRALEADDVASLPGWVFVRGFLKSCAREVGLDPDKTVAAFLAQHAPAEEPGEESTPKPSVFHAESVRGPIDVEPVARSRPDAHGRGDRHRRRRVSRPAQPVSVCRQPLLRSRRRHPSLHLPQPGRADRGGRSGRHGRVHRPRRPWPRKQRT